MKLSLINALQLMKGGLCPEHSRTSHARVCVLLLLHQAIRLRAPPGNQTGVILMH